MSKKTKPRRSAAASPARTNPARSNPARTGQGSPSQPVTSRASQSVTDQGPEQTEADAIVRRVLGDLWKAVTAGEPLQAKIEASTCMEIPRVLGVRDPAEEEQFRATVLVEGAVRRGNPEGAALLRLLMAMGTQVTEPAEPGAGPADQRGDLPAGMGDRDRQGDTRPGLAPVGRVR